MRYYQKYTHHQITNFPPNATWFDRLKGNILFALGVTRFTFRRSYLNKADRKGLEKMVQPGDLILVGTHSRLSCFAIRGPVTHVLLCVEKRRVIHAMGDGVEETGLDFIFKIYDTFILLRPKNAPSDQIQEMITFARSQLGKPFDFDFEAGTEKFFCSQLVNNSYHNAGFHTGVLNNEASYGVLHPLHFVDGNFDVQLYSHSLVRDEDDKFKINPRVYKSKLLEFILNK